MDRTYRWTRHIYDWSRRYYLLGRDVLLDRVSDRPKGRVLEVGCGTARNLRVLAHRAPRHRLFGLDASRAMLATARQVLDREGHLDRITLGQGLAEEFDPESHLGTDGPFDVIFFSYALSMIPSWPAALGRALAQLAPDGRLYIVDFWDQADLPGWVARSLQGWLSLFDVEPRLNLPRMLRRMAHWRCVSCSIEPVARRYAYLATVAPNPERTAWLPAARGQEGDGLLESAAVAASA